MEENCTGSAENKHHSPNDNINFNKLNRERMEKIKEIGYKLTSIMWRNIDELPKLWNKTKIPTKDKIVNETGELAVKLVIDAITKSEIALPIHNISNSNLLEVFENAVCDRNNNQTSDAEPLFIYIVRHL